MSEETWRDIPSCPSYQASSFGRIRSLDRMVSRRDGRQRFSRGRVLKMSDTNRNGRIYWQVKVTPLGPVKVQRLVIEAFQGPRPAGMVVCHKDDDPKNNRAENLYYGTRSDNTYDMVRNGNHNHARKTHCAKGHEFTWVIEDGRLRRRCRTCDRQRAMRQRQRLRQEL